VDILDRCRQYTAARTARASGRYPYFTPFGGSDSTVAHTDTGEILMCGANNYLGLTADERVRAAAREAVAEYGTSRTGSRLLNGNTPLHEELERELADLVGKPAALLYPTGYQANLGVIGTLLTRDDVMIADQEVHASAFDAWRMTRARLRRFAHNDPADLRRQLAGCRSGEGRLVVVDGVYSMAGDLAPLPEVTRVCREYAARLLVDDAHGLGVLAAGRGTAAHFDVTDQVDIVTLTFSKSFASVGGAVAGPEEVVDYLRHHSRSQMFSAAAPPASVAAALAALRILRAEPWRCARALENARFVRDGLRAIGGDPLPTQTPIVCVPTRDVPQTMKLWRDLLDHGVYVNAVIPPAAAPRLRASFAATHTPDQLDRVVAAFAAVREPAAGEVPTVGRGTA